MRNPRIKPTARDVRRAAASLKQLEIPGNKKAPGKRQGLSFGATEAFHRAPAAHPITPLYGANGNEILC